MPEEIRITLRLPANVHAMVKKTAEEKSRSMNEEIVTALSDYYDLTTTMMDEFRAEMEEQKKKMETIESLVKRILGENILSDINSMTLTNPDSDKP